MIVSRARSSSIHAGVRRARASTAGTIRVIGLGARNIGFHHVHHLNSLIPFYQLPRAMAAIPELQHPAVMTLRPRDVVASFRANIWDDDHRRMIRYRDVPVTV